MIARDILREKPSFVSEKIHQRGLDLDLDTIRQLDDRRRDLIQNVEALRHERNIASEEIGGRKKEGLDAQKEIQAMRQVAEKIKKIEEELDELELDLDQRLLEIPNLPHDQVPLGDGEEQNEEVRQYGQRKKTTFEPKSHWELGILNDILDFERAAKMTGARFALYRREGAQLERVLIQFMLDVHTKENNYIEILPPFMANTKSHIGTGQLPKFREDLFKLEEWDYFLIPTAEVPLVNLHREEILSEEELPLYYTAYTPCFRSEAGSYGKDTKGLIRQHQFNKVELVKFTTPDDSYDELEQMVSDAEGILQRLEIPYRVVLLCTGDLGFAAALTYDIEVWVPSEGRYREISSCSNCEEFQARRADIRYRPGAKAKPKFVHTLNGSGLAVGRTLVAVLENYQNADGSVTIPDALRPYMDGMKKIGGTL